MRDALLHWWSRGESNPGPDTTFAGFSVRSRSMGAASAKASGPLAADALLHYLSGTSLSEAGSRCRCPYLPPKVRCDCLMVTAYRTSAVIRPAQSILCRVSGRESDQRGGGVVGESLDLREVRVGEQVAVDLVVGVCWLPVDTCSSPVRRLAGTLP